MYCCSVCGEVRGHKHIFTHQSAGYFEDPDSFEQAPAVASSKKQKQKSKKHKGKEEAEEEKEEEHTHHTERRRHRILARVGPLRRCRFTRRRLYCSQQCVDQDREVRQSWLALSGFAVLEEPEQEATYLDATQFEVVRQG
jgi:hypothetical protein